MSEESQEYAVFKVNDKDGNEVEMAVVDEFNYEKKDYVVGAVVEGDEINEDSLYIYSVKLKADDFEVEKITDAKEYERIAEAYLKIEQ